MDKNTIATRVEELNKASEAYYNTGQPIMSDYEFDQKLEELRQWEEETGIVLSNSPTHNVGYSVADELKEVGTLEGAPTLDGRNMMAMLSPVKK